MALGNSTAAIIPHPLFPFSFDVFYFRVFFVANQSSLSLSLCTPLRCPLNYQHIILRSPVPI